MSPPMSGGGWLPGRHHLRPYETRWYTAQVARRDVLAGAEMGFDDRAAGVTSCTYQWYLAHGQEAYLQTQDVQATV